MLKISAKVDEGYENFNGCMASGTGILMNK